ncbi:protein MAINTENANCE OF MERISTEMS-like [Arachis ipaensis]|uniref:protein MAINTENANCE OF MERISTEMS-like n=1 Tax=Arachis ipaensis TaxID=130454 RepID=UPI000A2B038B|nr:protein MAINTENANCE OF MERISTEMS-like [Arachis ipaensis]
MSEEKKTIVRDLGFGGLMHIPPLKVHHQILRELANSFKLGENRLETGYGSFKVRQKIIGAALGINALGDLFPQKVNYKDLSEDDKQIFRRFQGKTLKNLTDEMMTIGVGNEQDRLMFKRIFILYIQMAFLLPTTINKISHVHLAPIFKMDTITEQNWGAHVLNFIIKGITNYNLKKKKAIDGCLSEIGTEDLDEFLRENNEKSAAQGILDVNLGSDDPSSQGHTDQSSVNKLAESM